MRLLVGPGIKAPAEENVHMEATCPAQPAEMQPSQIRAYGRKNNGRNKRDATVLELADTRANALANAGECVHMQATSVSSAFVVSSAS